MSLIDYFRRTRKTSAAVAKDRLQIIVARERTTRGSPDYLPKLQQELLEVIAKYEKIDLDQVSVCLDNNGGCEILELNIVLPNKEGAICCSAQRPVDRTALVEAR
jgi:cell division topological specificity factor